MGVATDRQADRDAVEALLARIARRDRGAFGALYDATSGRLFAVCLSVLRDRAEAEETLQEVYLRVWDHAGRYAVNGLSPMTWLIAIARNRSIDRLRSRARRSAPSGPIELAEGVACPSPSPEEAAIAEGQRARLAECLGQLDEGRADAVRAVYLRGATYDEVARGAGIPVNTVRTWLRRSLLRLRDCVGP